MDYTIEGVKRDLRRLKVDDLDPKTEERLMEMVRRWKGGESPDLKEEPEDQTEHRQPGHDQLKEIELSRLPGHDPILAKSSPERPPAGRSDSVVPEDEQPKSLP